ncbi:MAG: CotH kinase family protein, partial [Phycisphaerae bacterium]|nr:CotH kinase family protein [Phycisphaerae bacterium]
DVMTQPARPEGFPAQWTPNVVDYAMDRRVVFDPAYEPTFKQDLLSIPSVCIVIPNEDFFGSQGIYSHAQSSGEAWERAACIEWIDPNTGDAFGVNAGLRAHGGVGRSSGVAKHSLRITFRSEYGPSFLNFPLFDDLQVRTFDSLVLRGCWNYSWTGDSTACGGIGTARAQYMRDAFARDCMRDMGGLTPHGRHVNVYVNGLYWGIYILTERPDDGFASLHLGGDKSDYDVLKASNSFGTAAMETVAGDQTAWQALFGLLATADMADDEAYNDMAERVDIPALIDYMLMVAFVGSRDAPTLLCNDILPRNYYTLRNRTLNTGFIFLPWDVEWSLENEYENRVPTFGGQQNPGIIFVRLVSNRRFRQLLADRIHKHFFNGGALTVERATLRYWDRSEDLARAIVGESARWGDARRPNQPYTRDNEWTQERSRLLNSYLATRTDTVLNQLRSRGYYPGLSAPIFQINGQSAVHDAHVTSGDTLTLYAETGLIYYTLDGTDPMATLVDNSDSIPPMSPTAQVYTDPVTVQGRIWLKARTFAGDQWSALNEAMFTLVQK